jgi:hypothetical protein
VSYQRGRLLPSDELFLHQVVDTFATVSESDLSWTEKVWMSVFTEDGAIQIDAGLGKYPNRNVMDGFAGVSRGREQWTVRASRELAPDPETTAVGPLRYEVVRPLEAVRFSLDPNDGAAIAFDVQLSGLTPPFFEERDRRWDRAGFRVVSDLLRYHQPVTVTGWIEVEGERQNAAWVGFRDHSWGVRRDVGSAPVDVRQPSRPLEATDYLMHWAPFALRTPGGEWYELQYYLQETSRATIYRSGNLNRADGSQVRAWRVTPDVRFDPGTRRFLGGTVAFDLEDGDRRTLELEPMGDTGFHLGAGLYMGLDGHHHGGWRGHEHVEGEHIRDCTDPEVLRRIHQLRDCVVRVRDGEATGWGVFETIMTGAWPRSGVTAETSFL